MKRVESDVCIIGGGISAALLAERLTRRRPELSVTIVEAGKRFFDMENWTRYRQRMLEYGENPWPGDSIEDQAAQGIISRTMAVGGSALHWGGVTNRFSREDLELRSRYGLAVDWPIAWDELERYYCEAERSVGVAAEAGPYQEDAPSAPYPMPAMPLSHNLARLKEWAEKSGTLFAATPQAKNTIEYDGRSVCKRCNTCEICPTGARYSPDFTFQRLLDAGRIQLHDRTLVRRLVPHDRTGAIVAAEARGYAAPDETVRYEAGTFVLAAGYCWSSYLLLLSKHARYPNGLANSSGLVGRYMNGHAFGAAFLEVPFPLYPGMNVQHSLVSRRYFRCDDEAPFVRHDLRVWDSAAGRQPRLRNDQGELLIGDSLLADWRKRSERGAVRVRGYYDTHPARDSRVVLDSGRKNRFDDPLPRVEHRLDAESRARESATREHLEGVFEGLARAGGGNVLRTMWGEYLDHPAGGCRMGAEPAESVCDSHGRTHDHDNLYVVGSPTLPTGGCTNGTLTFAALTLRSADHLAETI